MRLEGGFPLAGVLERVFRPRILLAVMTALQLLWLSVIWVTGAASNAWKLPYLAGHTLVAGGLVYVLPPRFWSRLRWPHPALPSHRRPIILALALAVAIAGIAYASFQDVLTDERFLLQASEIVAQQGLGSFFADYRDIKWLGGQHPPLIPMVYGFAMRLLGTNVLALRGIATAVTVGTVVLTYLLAESWFDSRVGLVAALCLLSMPYCLRMGTAVLTDMPVTFLFALGLYLTCRLSRGRRLGLSLAAGICIGLGLVSKYTMLLIYPVLFCFFLADRRLRRVWPQITVTVITSASILAAWLLYAASLDAVASHARTVSRYAGAVTGGGWRYGLEMLSTELPSALGLYNLPLLLLGGLWLLSARMKSDLLVLLWVAPVMAVVALTLPDPRYFMPAFPGLAILMARGLVGLGQSRQRILLLALLHCAGALYLFADWYRASFVFLP